MSLDYEQKLASEIARLSDKEAFPDLVKPLDDDEVQGVMSADQIRKYVESPKSKMISDWEEPNLKTASYKMRVGNEYSYHGTIKQLRRESDFVEIPPFEVVIIKTWETLNLPRFIAGRWNITVGNAYRGLLWAGGPQVDPGWVGHLFCPIYNLSNETVKLPLGHELASIDFVPAVLTSPKTRYLRPGTPQFAKKPKSIILDMYPNLESGLAKFSAKLQNELDRTSGLREGLERKVENVENHVRQLTTWNTVILSLLGSALVAKLGIDYANRESTTGMILWAPLLFVVLVAIIAFVLHKVWLTKRRSE
jgi:deoxycytidine triphosphate deaminase